MGLVGLLDDVRGLLEAVFEVAGLVDVALALVADRPWSDSKIFGASAAIACSTVATCGSTS